LPAKLVMGFVDDEVNRLLSLDTQREVAFSLVALGYSLSPLPGESAEIEPLNFETLKLSPREVDYPAVREMHAASSLFNEEEVRTWRAQTPVKLYPEPMGELIPLKPLDDSAVARDGVGPVILRRGSTRRFAREKALGFEQFSTLIHRSTQGIPADFLDPVGTHLNDLYLIVNAVEGLSMGAYFLHRDKWMLELLKEGDFRAKAGYLGLEQDLPAEASATIFFLADLKAILERFGNRGYRAVQLEAGLLGGKMYLASYAQGFGATGLTFYDDDVADFFSPHAIGKSAIFLMAFGFSTKS